MNAESAFIIFPVRDFFCSFYFANKPLMHTLTLFTIQKRLKLIRNDFIIFNFHAFVIIVFIYKIFVIETHRDLFKFIQSFADICSTLTAFFFYAATLSHKFVVFTCINCLAHFSFYLLFC